jgi:hypothetical protein
MNCLQTFFTFKLRRYTTEELVDPFYAEYRRKRRLRRGSLSGNVDDDTDPITMHEMQQGMQMQQGMGQQLQQNSGLQGMNAASSSFFNTHSQAGAYTRPLFSSIRAVSDTQYTLSTP